MGDGDPMATALRLLTVRERSEKDLEECLRRKGFAHPAITTTLQRCRDLGYLDDRRFALERTRALMRNGRAVGAKVVADLKRHGIDETSATAALDQVRQEIDENELFLATLQRRFPDFRYHTAEVRERRRVVNYFLRRGFRLAEVLSSLQTER